MAKKFQRNVEDFTCDHCGQKVSGDGYTNHCPSCLWSLHVDVYPGDRAANCGGLMEPIAVEQSPDGYRILHRCQLCRAEKWNRAATGDDFAQVLAIAQNQAKRALGI